MLRKHLISICPNGDLRRFDFVLVILRPVRVRLASMRMTAG